MHGSGRTHYIQEQLSLDPSKISNINSSTVTEGIEQWPKTKDPEPHGQPRDDGKLNELSQRQGLPFLQGPGRTPHPHLRPRLGPLYCPLARGYLLRRLKQTVSRNLLRCRRASKYLYEPAFVFTCHQSLTEVLPIFCTDRRGPEMKHRARNIMVYAGSNILGQTEVE